MSPERITELRALLDAATPGPWHVVEPALYIFGPKSEMVADFHQEGESPPADQVCRIRGFGAQLPQEANAALIAAAPTAIRELLDEVERLTNERDAALETSRIAQANCDKAHANAIIEGNKARAAQLALESLTPGGSEFVGDPEYCVRHVEERRAATHEAMKLQSRKLIHAREENERLTRERDAERARAVRICIYLAEEKRATPNPNTSPWSDDMNEAAADTLEEAARAIRSGEPFRLDGESDESFEARCAAWEAEVARERRESKG